MLCVCRVYSDSQVLEEQLNSLFAQTAAVLIGEVWVCVFGRGSDVVKYAQAVVDETHHPNVRVIVSDFDFKFYGRFQVRARVELAPLFSMSQKQVSFYSRDEFRQNIFFHRIAPTRCIVASTQLSC